MYIYLNGEKVHSEEATISLYDHGYLYGVGLFETFRTYSGKPFLFEEHLHRLVESCQQIGIEWTPDRLKLQEQIHDLLQVNDLHDGYFRLNVSAGPEAIGLPSDLYRHYTEALLVKELPPAITEKKLATLTLRRNTPEGAGRLKSHHYLNNILAKREAPPDAEGVFLTGQGKVAEGIVSNLFFVKGKTVYTPALTTGILNGITREWVLKTAKELSLVIEEEEYDLSFAQQSDEVFVTNSIQEIVPVYEWDQCHYDRLRNKSVVGRLQEIYSQCTKA